MAGTLLSVGRYYGSAQFRLQVHFLYSRVSFAFATNFAIKFLNLQPPSFWESSLLSSALNDSEQNRKRLEILSPPQMLLILGQWS